jgi:uncharacterized membrane protein
MESPSYKHCCSGKAICITYSECVSVALGIQHEKRVRSIILSSVTCTVVPYFFTLSNKRHDFGGGGGGGIEHKMCVSIFYAALFLYIFLILRRIRRHMLTDVQRSAWSACEVAVQRSAREVAVILDSCG